MKYNPSYLRAKEIFSTDEQALLNDMVIDFDKVEYHQKILEEFNGHI